MKILLTIETTTANDGDDLFEAKRVTKKEEVSTINEALKILWKLKKPRMATITIIGEDAKERKQFGLRYGRGESGELFAKRHQRRGICVSPMLDSRDETGELPILHKSSYPYWRQLPTRFNEVMKDLLKKLNGQNQDGETGNAYDDLPAPKKKILKKKKKPKKLGAANPDEEDAETVFVPDELVEAAAAADEAISMPIVAEEDGEFDLWDEDEEEEE